MRLSFRGLFLRLTGSARRFRRWRPGFSEVWILLLARRHDLLVDSGQSLGGLLSLWRPVHNRSDTIGDEPNARHVTIGSEARPHARRRDLDAWSGCRLSGSRLNGCGLRGLGPQGVH